MAEKIVATNKKAKFDYFLLDTFEAGMVLKGSEIKSIRAGQISIKEAYIRVTERGAWLVNAHIATYKPANQQNHLPLRERKLLLHKKQILKIWNEVRQAGVTVIPTKIYLKNGKAKAEIAIAKGKRKYDKRQSIAKKDADREIARAIKNRR